MLVVCVTDVLKVLINARTVVTIVESSTAGSALIHMISPSVPCTHCGELGHYNVWVTAWHISTIRLYTQTVSHHRVHPEHLERLYHSKKYGFHLHGRPNIRHCWNFNGSWQGPTTGTAAEKETIKGVSTSNLSSTSTGHRRPWHQAPRVWQPPVTFDCVCPVLQCLVFAYFELSVFTVSLVLNCILVVLIICFVATPY